MEENIRTIIQDIFNRARELGACNLFTGKEDLKGLIALLYSPQGKEFCLKYDFPDIETLRLFKPFKVERFGIYIDSGSIRIQNPGKVILAGNTAASITCDTNDAAHEIMIIKGAKAFVEAGRWSVVSVKADKSSFCEKSVTGNAVIL